jgi:transcriptional regulator with PAS, ATPase and Fis domain
MKKDGVNIFQLQNVSSTKVVSDVVRALRIIDKLQDNKQLPIDGTAIQLVIEWLATQQLTLNEFMNGMKKAYIEEVIAQCETKSEAAKVLDIQRTYLSRISKSLQIEESAQKIDKLQSTTEEDEIIDAEYNET